MNQSSAEWGGARKSPSRAARSLPKRLDASTFLPTTPEEMEQRGWDALDILIVSGDAYVDHPAFGPVLVARSLEAAGYRVGFLAQPRWQDTKDVTRMGRPRLFVGVSAGNLDSMLNKLTAQKMSRSSDAYSPGGATHLRPNRASVVYANLCRRAFPQLPIVVGGIEASLRRFAHYDYWADQIRRSLLLDSKADLLVHGMGETTAISIARRLDRGEPMSALTDLRGTACVIREPSQLEARLAEANGPARERRAILLPSFEQVSEDKREFARMTGLIYRETNPHNARALIQMHGREGIYCHPPALPLRQEEIDAIYALPFTRLPHPTYREPIPALLTVEHSVVATRGCMGGCSFCSLAVHQGKIVQSRSETSLLDEVARICRHPNFSGTITDVGGPTANLYRMGCTREQLQQVCRRRSCLFPKICRHLETDHEPLLRVLGRIRKQPGVRHVYLASGVRMDVAERSPHFIQQLNHSYTGGMLSVAPEHVEARVLSLMGKPNVDSYERFAGEFRAAARVSARAPRLSEYFMTGHPGETIEDTIRLALYLKRRNIRAFQVQEFIPTPLTLATAMYYSGHDPLTLEPVDCVRDLREKRRQKALVLYHEPEQRPLAREALRLAHRADLIGSRPGCLVPAGTPVTGGNAGRLPQLGQAGRVNPTRGNRQDESPRRGRKSAR